MPNYDGGSVEIQIKSSADRARIALEALSATVGQVKGNLQSLVPVFNSINKLANGLRTIEHLKLDKVRAQIDGVGDALGKMSANLARTDLAGFNAQSEQAAFALNRLTNSFRQLDKLKDIDARRVYEDLSRLGRVSTVGIENMSTALRGIDLTGIRDAGASINSLVNAMHKIQGLKLDESITGNLKGQLDALTPTLTRFIQQLQGINTDGLQNLVGALKALPKSMQSMQALDVEKLGKVFSTLSVEIQPFLAQLREASAELQAFATISQNLGAKTVPAATKGLQTATKHINWLGLAARKNKKSVDNLFSVGKIYFFINYTKRAVQAINGMMKSAIDFTEIENLFSRSMGSMRDETLRFQNVLAETFGLALPDMMKSQALFNNIVKQLGGINEEMSAGISATLTEMSLDFAALYNQSIESAFDTFQAALTGQVKPVRRVAGMDITQQTLQTYLDEAGIARSVRQLNQVEKRLLTIYSLQMQMAQSRAIGAYAQEIENAANQLKILTEQVKETGRWIGSLFTPVIQHALPYLNGFVMAVKEIVKALALLVGYEVPVTADINDQLGLEEAEDGLGGVADGLEKIKQASTGIDELNIISPQQADDAASGVGGLVDPAILGLLQEYDNLMDGVRMKALDIRDAILDWLGFTKELNEVTGELDWSLSVTADEDYFRNLGKKLGTLVSDGFADIPWDAIQATADTIASNIAAFLNGAVAGTDWDTVGSTFAEGVNTAITFAKSWLDNFDWSAWGAAIADGVKGFLEDLDEELAGQTLAAYINSFIDTAHGFVTNAPWELLGTKLGGFINTMVDDIKWDKAGETLSNAFIGMLNGLRAAVKKVDWEAIGERVKDFLKGIDWKGILKAVADLIGSLVSGAFAGLSGYFGSDLGAIIAAALLGITQLPRVIAALTSLGAGLIAKFSAYLSGAGLASAGASVAAFGSSLLSKFAAAFGILGVVVSILAPVGVALYNAAQEVKQAKLDEAYNSVFGPITTTVEEFRDMIGSFSTENMQGLSDLIDVYSPKLETLGSSFDGARDDFAALVQGLQTGTTTITEESLPDILAGVGTTFSDWRTLNETEKEYQLQFWGDLYKGNDGKIDEGEQQILDTIKTSYGRKTTEIDGLEDKVTDVFKKHVDEQGRLTEEGVKALAGVLDEMQAVVDDKAAFAAEVALEKQKKFLDDIAKGRSDASEESYKNYIKAVEENETAAMDTAEKILLEGRVNAKRALDLVLNDRNSTNGEIYAAQEIYASQMKALDEGYATAAEESYGRATQANQEYIQAIGGQIATIQGETREAKGGLEKLAQAYDDAHVALADYIATSAEYDPTLSSEEYKKLAAKVDETGTAFNDLQKEVLKLEELEEMKINPLLGIQNEVIASQNILFEEAKKAGITIPNGFDIGLTTEYGKPVHSYEDLLGRLSPDSMRNQGIDPEKENTDLGRRIPTALHNEIETGKGTVQGAYAGLLKALGPEALRIQGVDPVADAKGLSKNMLAGMTSTFILGKDEVLRPWEGLFNDLLSTGKRVAQIASPSKATKEQGEFLVQGLIDGISNNAALITATETMATNMLNGVISKFTSGRTPIVEAWNAIFTDLTNSTNTLLQLSPPPSKVSMSWGEGLIDGLISGIKNRAEALLKSMSELVTSLQQTFVVGFGIEAGHSSVFAGFAAAMMNSISSTVSGMQSSVVQTFKNMYNAILTTTETFVNNYLKSIIAMFVGTMSMLSLLPGFVPVQMPKIEFISIPKFAGGGFPEDGLFFANHNELIGNVAGRTAVANNDMIVEALEGGVERAMARALSRMKPQTDNRPVVVALNGREIVRATRESEKDMGTSHIGGDFANA